MRSTEFANGDMRTNCICARFMRAVFRLRVLAGCCSVWLIFFNRTCVLLQAIVPSYAVSPLRAQVVQLKREQDSG